MLDNLNQAKTEAIERLKEKINDLEAIITRQDELILKYEQYEEELEQHYSVNAMTYHELSQVH